MPDPFEHFQRWFAKAEKAEPNDPNAMAVASATPEGRPSVRMVLLKEWDRRGFVFYTNLESRKGDELRTNPFAALLFHWKSLKRQIRIEGPVSLVAEAEADAYFTSRARSSRLGAWASQQSRPLRSRTTLLRRVAEYEATYFGGAVPRPPFWSGYRVEPEHFEFWRDMPFRLHERLVYTRAEGGWNTERLYP